MSGISIITGGGSGIGRALAKRLASRAQQVLIVGRNADKLNETKNESSNPSYIRTVVADVSKPEGRQTIVDSLNDSYDHDSKNENGGDGILYVNNLIHNAALLEPVGPLMDVELEQWRHHMAVNVEGPLFLTKSLLPRLKSRNEGEKGGRVLHVSSGAAHHGYRGWGPYCTSKAALHMIYKVLSSEIAPLGIAVGSARPGVVDTPMQDLIRQKSEQDMPDVSRFQIMKKQGSLVDPDDVAKFLDWLLHATDDVEFSEQEWDIRDDEILHRWENHV